MEKKPYLRNFFLVLMLSINLGCDQVSKRFVRTFIPRDQQYTFFDNHVMFTRVENKGAFLSYGDSFTGHVWFLVLIAIPVVALLAGLLLLFGIRDLSRSTALAVSFIIGGGLGNIYDRYLYGSVTDFVHLNFYFFRTGIFNMADVSIVIGFCVLLFSYLRSQRTLLAAED